MAGRGLDCCTSTTSSTVIVTHLWSRLCNMYLSPTLVTGIVVWGLSEVIGHEEKRGLTHNGADSKTTSPFARPLFVVGRTYSVARLHERTNVFTCENRMEEQVAL